MSMSPQEIFEVAAPAVSDPDATDQRVDVGQPITRGRLILRRFLRQKSGLAALLVLVLIFALAYLGPYLTHWKFDDFDQSNILTGPDSGRDDAGFLETNLPGVFAAGDVRHGAIMRVASAVGEGAMAVKLVHAHIGHSHGALQRSAMAAPA